MDRRRPGKRWPALLVTLILSSTSPQCYAFQNNLNRGISSWQRIRISIPRPDAKLPASVSPNINLRQTCRLQAWGGGGNKKNQAEVEEEARLKILESRRGQIRGALKAAETLRNFRIQNGYVPKLDEDGKQVKSDGKVALTATAFVVAFGAIALRIGGRAALVTGLGLDFLTGNPELQNQVTQILEAADSMDPFTKGILFCAAWTAVKVLCFDAGGVVLALSSGILFGGVIEGAVISAFAATVGSSAAFGLAKLDTPVRKKALEIVDDNPSLRGIEKVVAKDGLKAILTLRLAPILPIPIGFYNYVYGVTNVPFFAFAGGIFLGSLKPYLLDSYLGYFGKSLVDGSAGQEGGLQDVILLVALGVSVLIGVFASQLAAETWDSVLEEIEADSKSKGETEEKPEDDGAVKQIFGIDLPEWIVGFQYALNDANKRISTLIDQEYEAKAWNYTKANGSNPIPRDLNPAFDPSSPEVTGAYKGIDFAASLCDGLVFSPIMFAAFIRYANPLFDEEAEAQSLTESKISRGSESVSASPLPSSYTNEITGEEILERISKLRKRAEARLKLIDEHLDAEKQRRL